MLQRFVDAAAVEAEIERVQSLSGDALRRHWQSAFGRPLPRSLSVDLLRRMIANRIQDGEEEFSNPPIVSFLLDVRNLFHGGGDALGGQAFRRSIDLPSWVRTLTYCTGGYDETSNGLMVCPLACS
jgi:hypothetical protein